MTRRLRTSSLPLLAAAVAVLAAWIAACSGGGGSHSLAPCCAATGSVEQSSAAPAFAAAAAPKLFAQPFILETNNCIALGTLDLTALLDMPVAGKASEIDPVALTYAVTITEAGVGHQVAIVVYDDAGGTKNVRGIGVIGAEIVPSDTPIQVAPIELSPAGASGPTTGIGESTIETAAICELSKRGVTGALVSADVRAILTSSITASYTPSTTNASIVVARLLDYEAAIAGITQAGTAAQQAAFASFRGQVEAEVDACLAGATVAGCTPTADGIDLYRFGRYAAPDASAALDPWGAAGSPTRNTWARHAAVFIQDFNDRVGDPPGASGVPDTTFLGRLRTSMFRQSELFRVALAERTITDVLQAAPFGATTIDFNFSVTTASIPSLNAAFATLRASIGTVDLSVPDATLGVWNNFGRNVTSNLDRQLFDVNGSLTPLGTEATTAYGYASNVQAVLTSSSTWSESYAAVIDDGSGQPKGDWSKIRADVANTMPLNAFSAPDQVRHRVAAILSDSCLQPVPDRPEDGLQWPKAPLQRRAHSDPGVVAAWAAFIAPEPPPGIGPPRQPRMRHRLRSRRT